MARNKEWQRMGTNRRVPVIDKSKSKEFIGFLNRSGKTKEFWDEVEKGASTEIDKDELDKLFTSEDEEK